MEEGRGGAEEQARVVVLRVVEYLGGRALLDSLARVHDDDAVRDVAHGLDVVTDEHHG